MRRLLPIFIASVIAFYVTLLGVQAFSDGGQLNPRHYGAVGGVTAITALLTTVLRRQSQAVAPAVNGSLPDRFGSVARYLCETCGKPIRSKGWRCETCGATRKTWSIPKAMMSRRARHSAAEPDDIAEYTETSRDLVLYPGRPGARKRVKAFAMAVAFVAEQSGEPIASSGDLVRQLRTDPELIRRLYWAAAKRLHPDHNEGRHLPEWFQLQQAVGVVSAHPRHGGGDRRAVGNRRARRQRG